MQLNRVYICYLLTTLLISIFVYSLIYTNLQNMKKIDRIREEVDDIAQLLLQSPYNGKPESKYLSDLIDNFIKKRLAGIWDDLYSIKKQLKSKDCAAAIAQASKMHTKTSVDKIEERVNYAAEELGAKILEVRAEPICVSNFLETWLNRDFRTNPPILMLRSNMAPGSCFGFRNRKADVIIRLCREILIDQILVQHLTKQQSPNDDISSAPKDFQVFGLKNGTETFMGSFTFANTMPTQYFKIQKNERFQNLRLIFDSNHGHPNHTCVYRVGVYGKI